MRDSGISMAVAKAIEHSFVLKLEAGFLSAWSFCCFYAECISFAEWCDEEAFSAYSDSCLLSLVPLEGCCFQLGLRRETGSGE